MTDVKYDKNVVINVDYDKNVKVDPVMYDKNETESRSSALPSFEKSTNMIVVMLTWKQCRSGHIMVYTKDLTLGHIGSEPEEMKDKQFMEWLESQEGDENREPEAEILERCNKSCDL